jgi:hypothetical protein
MTDVLLYWRDSSKRPRSEIVCSSKSKLMTGLQPGDYLWVVTSGASLHHEERHSGFLIGIWKVKEAHDHEEAALQGEAGRCRVVLDDTESLDLDPVLVDHLLRPEGRDASIPIGRFVSVPRRLSERLVRKLRAAAGPELALRWLTGTRR